MSDLITDEMVDITAEAQWRYDWPLREFRREPDDLQDFYRNSARAALEAVAPLIAAKAWEEGYTEGSRSRMWDGINPYQTRADLPRACPICRRLTGHEPDCPVPWAYILDEVRDDRRRQERDDDAQWAAEQTTADWEWDE